MSSINLSDFYLIEDIVEQNIQTGGSYQAEAADTSASSNHAADYSSEVDPVAVVEQGPGIKQNLAAHQNLNVEKKDLEPLDFVYSNTGYFKKRIDSTSSVSFNFTALLLGPVYLAARKMSLRGLCLFLLGYAAGIALFISNADVMLYTALQLEALGMGFELPVLLIDCMPLILIHFMISLKTNVWYRKKCRKLLNKALTLSKEKQASFVRRKRGVSLSRPLFVFIIIFAVVIYTEFFISYVMALGTEWSLFY